EAPGAWIRILCPGNVGADEDCVHERSLAILRAGRDGLHRIGSATRLGAPTNTAIPFSDSAAYLGKLLRSCLKPGHQHGSTAFIRLSDFGRSLTADNYRSEGRAT